MNKLILLIIIVLVLLFALCCKMDCELHNHDIWHLSFDSNMWHPAVDTGHVNQNNDEQIRSYYKILKVREQMLCDLDNTLISGNYSYNEIVALLGNGVISGYIPKGKIMSKEKKTGNLIYSDSISSQKRILNQELLLYVSGFNASGNCYYIIVLEKGKIKFTGNIIAI